MLDMYSPQVLLQALCVRLEARGKPLEQRLLKAQQLNPHLFLSAEKDPKDPPTNASTSASLSVGTTGATRQSPANCIEDPSASMLDVPPPPSFTRASNRPVSVNLRKSPANIAIGTDINSTSDVTPSLQSSGTASNSWLQSSSRPQKQTNPNAPSAVIPEHNADDDDDEEVNL